MKFLFNDAEKLPPKPLKSSLIRSLIGGTLGILVLELLALYLPAKFMMAPFGETCVLLFAVSNSPLAQPRNVIIGHMISAFVGLVVLKCFGMTLLTTALAVGLAIFLMQWARCIHPPAGANPLVILLTADKIHYDWDFLLFPVLAGSVVLVLVALLVNNVKSPKRWPEYWFPLFKTKTDSH